MTKHRLHINVNMGALLGQLQQAMQKTIYLTALGLNATTRLVQEDIALPDTSIGLHFTGSDPWPIDKAREGFSHWILINGFREAAEAISGFLEEARTVVAAWQMVIRGRTESITFGEWQQATEGKKRRFHRLGLPDKIKELQENYSLLLEPVLVKHLRSINAVRNCLVHRGGIVRPEDIDESGALQVSWRRLVMIVHGIEGEREISLGNIVEAGEALCVSNHDVTKIFSLGSSISFSVQEFADLCWSLFLFGVSTTKLMEDWARERGIELQLPQDVIT